MKKVIVFLVLVSNLAFGACFPTYNLAPTCGEVVMPATQGAIVKITNSFRNARRQYILEPTGDLNTKIKDEYNRLNSLVYTEQKAILVLDNEIALELKKQEALLAKLASLKDVSAKYEGILQKANLNGNTESNATK
ncbi:hypothetical protein OFO01_07025 [Campylobacter sp. JMF_01 NE2]|uniref:hypothetical protein n=1 Tax=unclassified Campylobacter TaxID=2593542 RepID=UPI0022E9DF7A|nr:MULTISPECIES: hypothetical protein [unclassified Campylobacter]MDA3053285.1 hypothetical protein [Campylobacter sp. JMF_03 NE3]MDA3067532.1 hypothetical protein [Campylobacter sp. JMF_01 NE2]